MRNLSALGPNEAQSLLARETISTSGSFSESVVQRALGYDQTPLGLMVRESALVVLDRPLLIP